jgi:hypothetical protein
LVNWCHWKIQRNTVVELERRSRFEVIKHWNPGFLGSFSKLIVANGWKRFLIFTPRHPLQLFAWNEFATKIRQKRKETFLLLFCEATILHRYYNAFETVHLPRKMYRNDPLATKR